MKARFAMVILAFLALVAPMARAEGSDDQYIQIFNAIQQGDSLNERGEFANAMAKYTEAQTSLQRFQTEYPTWNPKIVKYRIEYVGAKIAELSSKRAPASVAAPTNAPAAPTTVALGVTVSILVLVELVGTIADQLPTLNQSVEAEPFQNSTARDGVIVAKTAPSATTDVGLRRRRQRQSREVAMCPRCGSIAATPTQGDSC